MKCKKNKKNICILFTYFIPEHDSKLSSIVYFHSMAIMKFAFITMEKICFNPNQEKVKGLENTIKHVLTEYKQQTLNWSLKYPMYRWLK